MTPAEGARQKGPPEIDPGEWGLAEWLLRGRRVFPGEGIVCVCAVPTGQGGGLEE